MDTTSTVSEDMSTRVACYELFLKYIREVLARVQQYTDELLGSCVELVLAVPRQFVEVSLLVPALKLALSMGMR